MAQERPVTPERQLLKLIEDSKEKKGPGIKAREIKHRKLSLFSFGAWIGRLSFFRGVFRKRSAEASIYQLDIRILNRALFLSIVALAAYFIWSFSMSMMDLEKMPGLQFETGEATAPLSSASTSVLKKSVSYYLDNVSRRNIFEMQARRSTINVVKKEPSSKIARETEQLKLVGISWSADPVAMIEDGRSLKTFFVKRGQMVGNVKIEAIFKDKVVLSYEGEEIELR